jgi:hypothetical protein
MQQCEDTPLPQYPSYHIAGLLLKLNSEGRNRAWRGALETMARINRIDWREEFGSCSFRRTANPVSIIILAGFERGGDRHAAMFTG